MPDRPTADDLAEWRRLADAASPGPWLAFSRDTEPDRDGDNWDITDDPDWTVTANYVPVSAMTGAWDDYPFIAAARTAVPALLAEVERLTTESADLLVYLNDAHARTDAVVKQRIYSDVVRAAVEARLVAIWPLARAALRLTSRNRAWDQVLDDDTMAAGEQFAAHITGYHTAWEELRVAAGALDPALRAELEARDDH